MERFVKGDVLVAVFPFSDLSSKKSRPVLVLGKSDLNDIIICQITSVNRPNIKSIKVDEDCFEVGKLPSISYVRPDKIFCSDIKLIRRRAGRLSKECMNRVDALVKEVFGL